MSESLEMFDANEAEQVKTHQSGVAMLPPELEIDEPLIVLRIGTQNVAHGEEYERTFLMAIDGALELAVALRRQAEFARASRS